MRKKKGSKKGGKWRFGERKTTKRILHKVPSHCCAETSRYQLPPPFTCPVTYSKPQPGQAHLQHK